MLHQHTKAQPLNNEGESENGIEEKQQIPVHHQVIEKTQHRCIREQGKKGSQHTACKNLFPIHHTVEKNRRVEESHKTIAQGQKQKVGANLQHRHDIGHETMQQKIGRQKTPTCDH